MKCQNEFKKVKLILLLPLLFTIITNAQIKKIQFGTSVVFKDEIIVADSMLTTGVYFDDKDRIMREWRIGRNEKGVIEDTSILQFDTLRNVVYSYSQKYFSFLKFDAYGNELERQIISPKYSDKMFYSNTYDSIGRIIRQTGTDGKPYFASIE
ncbi:MAG: hypothetical protein PSX81_06920 [bacterium]|nr:hypothetical protein [bacterium]